MESWGGNLYLWFWNKLHIEGNLKITFYNLSLLICFWCCWLNKSTWLSGAIKIALHWMTWRRIVSFLMHHCGKRKNIMRLLKVMLQHHEDGLIEESNCLINYLNFNPWEWVTRRHFNAIAIIINKRLSWGKEFKNPTRRMHLINLPKLVNMKHLLHLHYNQCSPLS